MTSTDPATGPATGPAPREHPAARRTWSRPASLWVVGACLAIFLGASSAPSPLYPEYAERWDLGPATVTLVFAVYAVALLAALLSVGGLSDHVGRRPVLLAAVAGEVVALILFALAGDAGDLVLARIVQGFATGALTGAAGAALVDLQPPGSQLGALLNTAGAMTGLALGSLGSGALVQLAPAPTHLVYVVLAALVLALAALLWRLPETSVRTPGAWRSLLPHVGVPPEVRGRFLVVTPLLVATWSMGALFLSLSPSIAGTVLGLESRVQQGFVIALFTGSGATAAVLTHGWPPRRNMLVGAALLAGGTSGAVVAVTLGSAALFLPVEMVAGAGFGLGFTGALQLLMSLSQPSRRAELLAAVFVVNYLAFSVPAVVAGLLVPVLGLSTVAEGYGSVVVVLALVLLAAEARVDS